MYKQCNQQNNQTTKQPDNTNVFLSIDILLLFIDVFILFVLFIHSLIIAARFVWKTIPSEARLTRDEVSGLQLRRKELSGRQYQHKQNLRAHRYATTTNVQNLSRIKRMRRICSLTEFFYSFMICLRLPGAMIVTDYLLLEAIQHRIGANIIRSSSNIKWLHKNK